MPPAAALVFADGRFPSGGHAHSGGIEAAVDAGRVHDLASLEAFLSGRLATAGRVAASVAAAACSDGCDLARLDAEMSARTASPALRQASRRQGAALLRSCRQWVTPPTGGAEGTAFAQPHLAVAMGMVAAAVGLSPVDAARWAAYDSVSGPAGAAVRLLGLDPFATWGLVAALAPHIDEVATAALGGLASCSAPLLDIGAEHHATGEVKLFAS